MPELPDIVVYIEALRSRVRGEMLERVRIKSPSLLRTWDPPISAVEGRTVAGFSRIGKRIVLDLGDELFMVFHLMIAGRLRWRDPGAKVSAKIGLAAFDFPSGTLLLTEASSKKRAQLHVVQGTEALAVHDPGGLEIADIDLETFAAALRRENHTLKRTLTDPRVFSGIGNAYSDEIFHAARLSPIALTQKVSDEEVERLFAATRATLDEWTQTLRDEAGDAWPEKVTAFRKGMAVHGKHGKPCPVCKTTVQRIVRAANEINYCPECQTKGRLLADRALSRLLKKDWPKTLEEFEDHLASRREKPGA